MKEIYKNKLNLDITDLLDKLIIPSEHMEKMLKDFFNIKFLGDSSIDKYNCKFWILKENLRNYSIISFKHGECDKYEAIATVDCIIFNNKVNDLKIEYFINLEDRFIPNREETQQNVLISYLKYRLVENGDFRMFGPKSFIHDKTDDKIIVYIRQDTMHIIHDGECVCDNFSIDIYNFDVTTITAEELDFYFQEVIHHF